MITNLLRFFGQKWVIILMLVINIPGTIFGYVWYGKQLEQTPWYFLLFVPDSPTASLFFVFVLIAFLFHKNWPLMEALGAVTLIKYGIWAVAMNISGGIAGATLTFDNYMLIFSHLGMAIQAVLYAPYYRMKLWHLLVAAIWTLHNDIIDYVFMMHPWVSHQLLPNIDLIGYFTFWLSIISISLVYVIGVRGNRLTLEIK
ncbi:DUF1405 domain-containing protein [Halalkalibacter krulwichiae]|uniref:DUF1405 domain-containing protein n=1 Tax=Halalkalibacter krulwichiae TaxID=199441 RepID=A0A1X9MA42_9BACI|nr:DUF1405 domain-containing protein [Halalkalibacter krulwichiae]ARK30329.1 hypothetical protein BkAM31D_11095 [Halalkalibacter krulwichiae]